MPRRTRRLRKTRCERPDPRLTPYDSAWERRFAGEAPGLTAALRPVVAIEHVGSTSIPGLAAKPTVDVALGVASLDLDAPAHERVTALGFHYGGTHDLPQQVFRKGTSMPWDVLVHHAILSAKVSE